jgi:putative DNA primase/helicase
MCGPGDDEVDGEQLLADLTKTLHEFVVMTKHQARAVALWTLFSWCFGAAHCALKLWIKSPEKRSGKTRLVEILSYLVRSPLVASGMTVAAFYRLIDMRDKPTILLDEFDSWASDNQEFRGVLNAGFDKRTALKWVCVGDNHAPTPFDLFTPMVVCGIGEISDTVADRSLKIGLKRKLNTEKVSKLRRRGTLPLDELAQKCARWSKDNTPDLMNADPEIPESINDRAADGWELMLAIADHVGGPWPQSARQAAIKLSGDGYDLDGGSRNADLAHDILVVLQEHESVGEQIPSKSLVLWLVTMEERPWAEFKNDRPPTPSCYAHSKSGRIMARGVIGIAGWS